MNMNNILNSDKNKELIWNILFEQKIFNNIPNNHIESIKILFDLWFLLGYCLGLRAPGPLTEWHRRLPVDLHNARKDVTQFFRLPFYSIHSLPLPSTKSVVAVPKVTPDEMTRDLL